jgi:hypothetical protein
VDEDSRKYWIVPLIALAIGCMMGAGAIEYKLNTVLPAAIAEKDELRDMSCKELKTKNSQGRYWTPENGKYGRTLVDACPPEKKVSSGLSPYVEFCDTTPLNPPFWPDKLIQNDTHTFNHEFCVWDQR